MHTLSKPTTKGVASHKLQFVSKGPPIPWKDIRGLLAIGTVFAYLHWTFLEAVRDAHGDCKAFIERSYTIDIFLPVLQS